MSVVCVVIGTKDFGSVADNLCEDEEKWWEVIMTVNNINNSGNKVALEAQRASQQQTQQQSAVTQVNQSTTAGSAKPDAVSLTQSAQQLNTVQKKGDEAPVDKEKVAKLKEAITNGEYKVDPQALARKIAMLEQQVFGK